MGQLPKHIAIICDGNRRWARAHGMQVFGGHERAVKHTMDTLVAKAQELGISHLTFWVFSTENWDRAKVEVDFLMNLFRFTFDEKLEHFHNQNIRVRMIGNRLGLAEDIQKRIVEGEALTKENTGMTVTLAINYGGRDEIIRAVKSLWADFSDGGSASVAQIDARFKDLNMQSFSDYLDTHGMPDPDLIIRTSGEQRLSGFMPWQQQYAEFYFPKTTFPDFDGNELEKAVEVFMKRERRFGAG